MEIIKPRTLSGFMELLPEKQLKFDRMAEVLRKTYASYGFAPLDTPVICLPRAAEKRKSRSTASPRATATLLCAST